MSDPPTFTERPTFLGLPFGGPTAPIGVAGIPLDIGTTNRAGARFGPGAIRRASRMLVDGPHPTWWNEPAALDAVDAGDFRIALGDIPQSLALIQEQAAQFEHLIALGGEHGISLPLLRALAARIGPVALVHFDAHVDTWPENFGQVFAHGSIFFHAVQEGLIDPRRTVQIGIRSPVQRAVHDWTVDQGVTVLSAQHVHRVGPDAVAETIRSVVGDAKAYLSFDVDALDPAFAPGTGTPEIGGLASWQVQAIIRQLSDVKFVGMDVVEVSPPYDVSEITALVAATVAWEYMALLGRHSAPTP
jgi:agmatinase